MYCDGGVCNEFCQFSNDCKGNEICCQKGDFGFCEARLNCEEEYKFLPEPVDLESLPFRESPNTTSNFGLYSILALLALLVGTFYFFGMKKR